MVNALSYRSSFGYDTSNRQITVTDALGNVLTTVYDANRRTVARINANGFVTSQVYDALGQRIAIIDARGNRSSFTWDAAGRQTVTSDALGNLVTSQYDAASRQIVRIDGRSLRTSYAYDAASRLTGQQYQDGTRVTIAYDVDSRRTVLSDWTGLYTSTYDQDGRLSAVVNPAGITITYSYDAVGQRAWMAQPTGRFTYVFDPVGRISTLTNPEGQTTSWSYDAASRVTAQVLANGVRVSNTYDNADHLLLLANLTSTGTTLSSFNYAYNVVGNRTRVLEVDGSVVTWSYDPTYQLTNEQRSGPNSYSITYTYDAVGNRTLMVNNAAPTTYTYNAANEMATCQTGAGTTTYTFDGDGNLLTSLAPGIQLTTNTWDGENRLTQVALPSALTDIFTYNGDGLRVQKQDSTGTTRHVWDDETILLETNSANAIQVVYTLQPGGYGAIVSQSRGGADSFYLFDALGSTRTLTTTGGVVTDTYVYGSFGELLTAGVTTNPFRYIGRFGYYFDADTSWYYIRARYYAPVASLFVSRDYALVSGAVARFLKYYYCANDPVNTFDPSGLVIVITPMNQGNDKFSGELFTAGHTSCGEYV